MYACLCVGKERLKFKMKPISICYSKEDEKAEAKWKRKQGGHCRRNKRDRERRNSGRKEEKQGKREKKC